MVLQYYNIPTAPFAVVPNTNRSSARSKTPAADAITQSPNAAALVTYPLFAKLAAEGSSKGILPISRIECAGDLEKGVTTLCERYPGCPILIERFLPGNEYTVGIIGTGDKAQVLGVVLYAYHAGQDGLNFMWDAVKTSSIGNYVSENAADMDQPEVLQAADTALKAYRAIGIRDAGRVDVRVDESGVVNVMELNPLSGLNRDYSPLPRIANNAGWSYEQLLQVILNSAMERSAVPYLNGASK